LGNVRALSLVVDADKETTAKVQLTFTDEAGARKAYWPARDGLALLRLLMTPLRVRLRGEKGVAGFLPMLNKVEQGLRTAGVKRENNILEVALRVKGDLEDLVGSARATLVAVEQMRRAAARAQSVNNLRQIGVALHNYHSAANAFPAAAIYSKDGKPLLSWRVALLPYLEKDNLYKQFKFDEPWDGPNNKKLLAAMPRVYAPVGAKPKTPHSTFYQVCVGKGAAFEGKKGLQISDFTDGTASTIWLAEAAEAVPWTKPEDIAFDPGKPVPKLGGMFPGGFHVGFADGSVRFLKQNIDKDTLRALITRNGNETIDLNKLR